MIMRRKRIREGMRAWRVERIVELQIEIN